MKFLKIYANEAFHELRAASRGPLLPVSAVGLTLYLLLALASAETMREMGASGVPRNSAHLVYLMTSGMSLWLFFIWAWIFGQVVLRDRQANLHENVLSAPLSLTALLLSRYLGACVVAFVLGAILPLGMLLVPVLGWLSFVPPELIAPAPWYAILWSLVFILLPITLGVGAIYVCTAIWMRNFAGPFIAAALLMLIWMVGMIVLRGGNVSDVAATLFDPTVYAEAELQTYNWTPEEKISRPLDLSIPFVLNRLIWGLLPLLCMLTVLFRVSRERLVMESGARKRKTGKVSVIAVVCTTLPPVGNHSWISAALSEAGWHLRQSFAHWGMWLALAILTLIGVGGSISHVMQHGDGPMIPRWQFLVPFMGDFFYLFMLFMVAGFVGSLARRDMRPGFGEMIDATPAPDGARVMGRFLAAMILTLAFTLSPALSAWIVIAIGSPSFSFADPLIYQLLVVTPALLEITALTLLIHMLIRHSGTAYAVSMIVGFIAIVNHEINLLSYPPAQIAIMPHLAVSALSGWAPWLAGLISLDLFKLGLVIILGGITWLVWPRGNDLTIMRRWTIALQRIPSYAGLVVVLGVALMAATGIQLYAHLVTEGDYQSLYTRQSEDAAWEKTWWKKGAPFSVQGGSVNVSLNPEERLAETVFTLQGVKSDNGFIHGSLPQGMSIVQATVEQQTVSATVAHDHFSLPLSDCHLTGCEVVLSLAVTLADWPLEHQSWLHPSGVWLRASDILPTLGHDPQRRLITPQERTRYGLDETLLPQADLAMRAIDAVAPHGEWRWSIVFPEHGEHSRNRGTLSGALNFAAVWLPQSDGQVQTLDLPEQPLSEQTVSIWRDHSYQKTAQHIADDLIQMQSCIASLTDRISSSRPSPVNEVIQSPRELGNVKIYDRLLWLPEHQGWDVAEKGFGRVQRRAKLAEAIMEKYLGDMLALRAQPGAQWLMYGISGWSGMECIRKTDGDEAWLALMNWHSDQLTQAMGTLSAPVSSIDTVNQADWLASYSTLAVQAWAAKSGVNKLTQDLNALIGTLSRGATIPDALAEVAGPDTATRLLGMPLASDIALATNQNGRQLIKARRWQWHQGGWQLLAQPAEVVRISNDDRLGTVTPLSAISDIESVEQFTLLDVWPSAERTPDDNIWKAKTGNVKPVGVDTEHSAQDLSLNKEFLSEQGSLQ